MRSLARVLAFAIVMIITIVTYCAQSCFDFDLEAANPECPAHHTNDCCTHHPTDAALATQTLSSFGSTVTKYIPQPLQLTEFHSPQRVLLNKTTDNRLFEPRKDASGASLKPLILRI